MWKSPPLWVAKMVVPHISFWLDSALLLPHDSHRHSDAECMAGICQVGRDKAILLGSTQFRRIQAPTRAARRMVGFQA